MEEEGLDRMRELEDGAKYRVRVVSGRREERGGKDEAKERGGKRRKSEAARREGER